MKGLVIGCGAAGNKAVIELLKREYVDTTDVMLVNSTLKDIPVEYRGYAVQLSQEHDGCGQERDLAKEITLYALESNKLKIKELLTPEHEKIIIVTSIEGGTGSGSSVILANYCHKVLGMPTEIIGFKGFEDTTRGLQNTIEWFQDLDSSYGIQTICNNKFLKTAGGNRLKAEKLANEEFCTRIKISLGLLIEDAEQNIDTADIFKVSNTTGYTTIEYSTIDEKIKSVDQFNAVVKEMLDNTKSIEPDAPTAKRLGVIINMNPASQNYIDYGYSVVRERMGKHIYEVFPHIQYNGGEEFIALIVSGMRMPMEEVKAIYEKYKEESDALDTSEDNFFDEIRALKGNAKDGAFNMLKSRKDNNMSEADFFKSFSVTKNDKKKELEVPNVNKRSEY